MTRSERKQATIEKRERLKLEKREAREDRRIWNDMIKRAKKKDALISARTSIE